MYCKWLPKCERLLCLFLAPPEITACLTAVNVLNLPQSGWEWVWMRNEREPLQRKQAYYRLDDDNITAKQNAAQWWLYLVYHCNRKERVKHYLHSDGTLFGHRLVHPNKGHVVVKVIDGALTRTREKHGNLEKMKGKKVQDINTEMLSMEIFSERL